MRFTYALIIVAIVTAIGCSTGSGGDPLAPLPGNEIPATRNGSASHTNWGLWQFVADPEAKTLDFVQLRTGAMHVNVLPFLDMPPLVYLTLESLEFNGNLIDTDIGLRHPFLGLTEFTGFDVKGVFISNGSLTGFTDTDLIMTDSGDTRLLNPDGYTRWWNPDEFPHDAGMFGYMDGALGAPDSHADYNCTLNGYKFYCDNLSDPDSPLSEIDPEGHAVFGAGQKNVRHFAIELGDDGLIFNYAVDASWQYPEGDPPWETPDDFPAEANQPEAYRISITETENTLYYDEDELEGAGDLSLSINVYDWFNADLHTVYIEWPGFISQTSSAIPTGGGLGYSTYEIDMIGCTPSAVGEQLLFITIESEVIGYGQALTDEPVCAYFVYDTDVPAGSGVVDPVDICTGWGVETGPCRDASNNPCYFFLRTNLASDSNGNVWEWCQRTSNAISRCSTPFNGDWATMNEQSGLTSFQVFSGYTVHVSLTPTFDGGLIAGCSPPDYDNPLYPNSKNRLSIAWWDGSSWHEQYAGAWLLYNVLTPSEIARRINGYRDSTDRFHAFIQAGGSLIDYYGDTWQGSWSQTTVGTMPVGQADYACQTRTDFVAETSDGWIYLCWVDNGIKVARCQAGTTTWNEVYQNSDPDYDSPTIYIDGQDRVFLVARHHISTTQDEIHLFMSTDGTSFSSADVIFTETDSIVDPCYLSLKGDSEDNLFLTFPYRPDANGAHVAIIAGNPGGTQWTDICVLTADPIVQYPVLAVRPDGSIEMCYSDPTSTYETPSRGSTDYAGYSRNYIMGRSHAGFVD